jgi:hypothetical protein
MRARAHTRTPRILTVAITLAMVIAALPAVALAAIPNDHPEQATEVTSLPFQVMQDTSGATDSPDDPECTAGDGHSVWFSFTPESTIDVVANTFGSDYDTTLSVYIDDGGPLVQIACNDDWEYLQSQVFWTAEANVTYLIMVGAFGATPGGNLTFTMDEGTAPPQPPQIDMVVTVTGGSVDPKTGEVTIRGEVMCSAPATGSLWGEVRQRVGRVYISGYFDAYIECDVEPTQWVATTSFMSGVFKPGQAQVSGMAMLNDAYGDSYFDTDVRLASR